MENGKKTRGVGRPRLPKGAAKGRIIPVRFDADDLSLVMAAAKSKKQTVSEWIREALRTAAEVSMFKRTLHDAMSAVLLEQPEHCATTSFLAEEIGKRGLYERKDGASARAGQISARAAKYDDRFRVVEPGKIQLLSVSLTNK